MPTVLEYLDQDEPWGASVPDDQDHQSPEILKQIQAAERKVERMLRSAEQEAAAVLERARAQARVLEAERGRAREEKLKLLRAEGLRQAENEATRIILEAKVKGSELKTRAMTRLDEAVDLVLRRILHA